jgi:alpha-glucoside transport system permease protein
MAYEDSTEEQKGAGGFLAWIGRILLAILIPLIAFGVLYAGFLFLRDSDAPKWLIALIAIIWGVGGVAALYWVFNWLVEMMPDQWTQRLQPFVFIGPAIAILVVYLVIPSVRTLWFSFLDRDGAEFVGLQNYVDLFSERLLQEAIRNNVLWIVFGSTFSVASGLLIAVLADRSRFERLSKSFIFLPMAISFVGASVIWNFIYEVRPAELPQIGLLNAIVVGLGGDPKAWYAWVDIAPWNDLFLIIIVIWLQTGFAMVLFSAALKGIPEELMEAARVGHHSMDDHRHLHPEDLRCRLGNDGWPIWYSRHCYSVLPAGVYGQKLWHWLGYRHRPTGGRRAGDDLQPAAVQRTGGVLR